MRHLTTCACLLAGLALPSVLLGQDLPEASPEAIRAHAQGLDHYLAGENDQAIEHFYRAHELDPTFVVPLFMAGLSAGNAGRGAQRDSLFAVVNQYREQLSPYYRSRLDAHLASAAGDLDRARHFSRLAAVAAPGTKAAYNYAQLVANLNRPAEAIEFLETLDPTREPMRGWISYWSVLGNSQHALGRYEPELATGRSAAEAFPEHLQAVLIEAQALASLGRMAELDRVLERGKAIGHTVGLEYGEVLTFTAQELLAHGHPEAAASLLERAVAWFEKGRPDGVPERAHGIAHAYALYTAGRYDEAKPIYAALAKTEPRVGAWQGWVGYLAALTGDGATARRTIEQIRSGEIELRGVNPLVWQAFIRAGLGEADAALDLFERAGINPRWMHRDPVLTRVLGEKPEFAALLAPAG